MRSVNNKKMTSIMLVVIMIMTPVLSLQTNMLDEGTNSLDNNIKFNTQSTNSIVDCELTNVSITEVYHYSSNEWIEIYNNGNQTCDLGEWIIGNYGNSFEIANNTNISSNNHLLFIRGTDFSFDISCNDQLLISTRDVEYANATEITALDCYGPNDDYHYDSSSDGSWEFCDGYWDWNEADEMTQNATNLCAGNPFTLSTLLGNGTWSHNPILVENGSSTLAWNLSNLDEGVEYRLYSSWNTGLTSFSRSYYFDGGIDEIIFDMFSDIDWTCEVYFYAYIVNESSNIVEEYFQKNMDVSTCSNGELTYLLDGTTGIQNGHNFSAGLTSFTTISSGIDSTLEYIVEIKLIQDNTITDWNNEECNYSSNSNCGALVDNLIIYHETCILEFTSTLYVKSPYGWINILSGILEGNGPCDSDSDDISGPIKLYANMTDSNGFYSYQEVTSDNYELNTNDTNIHNFYWAFPLSSYGNEYRFHSYFDGETVFDLNYYSFMIGEDTVDGVDSYNLHWNATSSGHACSPNIYAYMYIQSPSGSSNSLDYWYQNMQVNNCNSFGEVELYNNGVNTGSDNDLLNGTNNMSWNLTELDIGREYVLEWYSSRSSSYTNNDNSVYGEYYNKTIFIANSENNTIDWTINAHGSWCDLDISFRLHTPLTTQDWQDSFEEVNYPYFTSNNYDLDPVCDGSDIPEYNPVSLFYDNSGIWNEVNDSTNLSAGIYDMKWEINGGSDWSATPNLVLSTSYETFLNSSTQSRTYYNEGDSSWEQHWELIISDWSCNIDFDYDLDIILYSNNHYSMDEDKNNPFIEGPCNDPMDISSSNSNEPSHNLYILLGNSTNPLDSQDSFDEGENTIRWKVENTVSDYEHMLHAYLNYNGHIQEFTFDNFLGDGTQIVGDFNFELEGDICSIQFYSNLYVKEYNTWDSIDSSYTSLSYDGNTSDCDYQENQIGFSVLDDTGNWNNSIEMLTPGNHQVRFDMGDLIENVTYYISSSINGQGSQSQHFNGYFSIGQPTVNSNDLNDYFGQDIYHNITVNPWTCSLNYYANLYYISPTGSWSTYRGISSSIEVENCESAGEISISSLVDNHWTDEIDVYNYPLETGVNDLYWNMTNLNVGETYQLYFYAYKDNIQIYSNIGDTWVANSAATSWHFPVTIEGNTCNFYAYAYLRILNDEGFNELDYINFNPEEPCTPNFDINFITDSSSVWFDAQTENLPVGTTQMMFNLSELGEGDYEIDYYWHSDNGNSMNWDYDNYFTVDENNNGFYWNITLEKLDCSIFLDLQVYDMSYGGNYQIGNYNDILLQGPCMLPFDLDVNGVEFDNQDGNPDLSLGDNDMAWTFDNLETGINYYLYFNWYNGSNGYSENYYFTYNESNDYTWNLPIGDWDCNPYAYASLYYADNGTHIFGNEWFYFNVPECYSVWIDHTDSDGDYMDSDDLSNGSNDMSWNIYDLPEGYEFALEMRTYMNGYMQEYSYELFNDSGNVSIDFSIDVDTYSVCDVRVETTLYYLDSDGNWDSVTSNSRYFYQSCDSYESMYPWTVLVDTDADGNYSEVSQYDNIGGNGTIPMMLDLNNLAEDEIYRVDYSWTTASDSEYFNWEDVTLTNNQFYFDVPVTNWDCEVNLYVYIQYETLQGYYNHMISTNQYFNTDCLEPGNVSLNMDNMGEVWDDWSNLNNGTNDMSWEMTDLIVGETYTIDWFVKYNYDIVSYEYLTWTAGDSDESIQWSFDMDNSTTCNVEIMYRMYVDSGDSNWIEMDNEYFYWYPSCDQWVYPRDHYVNLNVEINGTMVENPETLPSGEVDFEIHFENMSVGADYRMYFYYSNTGFNSNSQYIYFTYDGSPMEMTIDIAPWACSVYFNYDMRLYDFRYDSGNSYNDWYLGSESRYIDGPCETLNYDSSDYPNFTVTDDAGNDIDDETDFSTGNNTIILGADNLQNEFPYYMELQVRYDGYLNVFKTHTFTGNNTTAEEFAVTFDILGHVCNVEVRSYFYVITSSGSNQLNYTNYYADGPCDGADGESRLSTPLHAYINGTWIEVDDDTFFPAGETEMSWDLSALDSDTYYYMNFNGPNLGWGGYFYGDNIPEYLSDWSMTLSEFRCDISIYNDIYAISDYTGWNGFNSQYFYPDNDCLDGGDITLEAQDDEGNWTPQTSYGFDLLPGTTNFSWSLDNLLEGYDYEFYWYQQGSDYVSEYQYFTVDSNGSESVDFSITIDQYECNVYFYAYLRPMSEYTDMYEETESFSFWPNTPCYPPFNFAAEDAAGNLTVDALDLDFVLSPGDNHLFFDFNHMDNGTTYYLDWYWSSQNSWNGWYQNYVYVDTSDNVSDGLHFNMTLDSMECYAYVYVNVYNYSNGNSYHMGNYNMDFEGPCMLPFDLDVPSNEGEVEIGVNNLTWNIDNLDVGSNYTFQYYYSMNSGFYGWYNYEFTYNESESFDFTINVTEWDCNVNINANIYNSTDGNMNYIYGNSLNLYNPNCYQVDYYALDESGDWIQYNNIDAGTSELFWEINYFNENIPSGYEFKLEYQIIIDNDWANPTQSDIIWTQDDDATQQLSWNITINEFVCDVYVTSSLYVNTPNGWSNVRGNGFNLYAPCEPMPSGWYNFSMDDNGTWNQFYDGWNHMIQEEGVYEMRWDVMDLEIGVTYEMSWVAHAFGHELSSYSMQWNATDSNGTLDFNITIPHWYCGMEFESKLSFDNDGTMFEIASNYYYEEGPCDNSIEEFTDSFSVDFDLILINDNLYSQDYELMIPFGYILNDEIKLYLDAVFGNMDGILNASEATMAENSFNSQTDDGEEAPLELALNGVNLTSFTFNPAILSNLTGIPTFTGSWILEYFDIYGVEITSTIEIESEDEIEWHFNILENLDMTVESIQVTDSENVYSILTPSFILSSGNYSLNITWLLANIQDPILELEQLDMVSEEFDELTNIMDESFNENMTIHTFQINLTNLSYQEYVITYNVHIDEHYEDNVTYYIYQEVSNDITSFTLLSNIHTCNALISIEVYDRNNEQVLSENYTLMGTCQPYDYDMDGVSDEDDAFPYDATEWLDTDGDGYGDNSDVFPNDATEWLDTDGDGIGNNADTDDDDDGLDDEFDNDNDGDGVVNDDDMFPEDPTEWNDTDSDGYGDNSDVFPNDASEWEDSDGDGIGDNSDDDADGDGVPNDVDDLPLNPGESSDSDGDGVGNNQDAFPNDASEWEDSDGDGIGDNSDDDDDGDGVVDESDAFPLDSTESMDSDNDGFGDNKDAFPNDPNETTDSDGDNVGDNADAFPSNFNEWADSDGDGFGDNEDVFPNDYAEWLDSDGDNVGDNSDKFPGNLNEWADHDGDNVGDNADAFPNDLTEWLDSDGDNVGDNSDAFPNDNTETVDTDGDGVGDNAQAAAEAESGGLLSGFSSITGLISILGAAILVAGRRKD